MPGVLLLFFQQLQAVAVRSGMGYMMLSYYTTVVEEARGQGPYITSAIRKEKRIIVKKQKKEEEMKLHRVSSL
ncbi:hypothetical protein ASPBRDRAFT_514461 [Aspergillus brasiliensis CBS 101740]|uniref:Secreted protein n=1 Tax=Aspergillus brasiliensis (strain CBS 101740 / IMI 381727 / IBT 21946) TaxID=767769 RepID=A0A1L9UPZ8_ASPBC|nr:hypothetical protein ASPBRDRAFT_514461 [Aspergillus brasiliensis CBS 101740]